MDKLGEMDKCRWQAGVRGLLEEELLFVLEQSCVTRPGYRAQTSLDEQEHMAAPGLFPKRGGIGGNGDIYQDTSETAADLENQSRRAEEPDRPGL